MGEHASRFTRSMQDKDGRGNRHGKQKVGDMSQGVCDFGKRIIGLPADKSSQENLDMRVLVLS